MSKLFSRLLHDEQQAQTTTMDRRYVSEFTRFMESYLTGHPEVVAEQRTGWRIYWDKRVDLRAQEAAEHDRVPDDGYGFHPAGWIHGQKP